MSLYSTSMDYGTAFDLSKAQPGAYDSAINQNSFSKSIGSSWAAQAASETRAMKKVLRSHSVTLGSFGRQFGATSGSFRQYTPSEYRASQGQMNSAVKDDLQAVHYKLGEDGPSKMPDWYETDYRKLEKSHWNPARTNPVWAPPPESPNMRTQRMGQTMRTFRSMRF
eukprot:TRINITY_DN94685_c0_g1_i1.p1 TRINITY_DN94685_c0_g1~~TRINITY_DN94685_c0_g1_i1.p1  ORF type:complete len:167 (-),score=21.39 TRINITY_DN94685_c0_g1_i1:36-536(-)